MCVSVCRPRATSQIWEQKRKAVLVAPSNAATQISPPARRGFDVTATLLAPLRHKSRRRRAPRPAAGSPTHAIAGGRECSLRE